MLYASCVVIVGLVLLVWSADKFVEGAASAARCWGMPPLLIGIVILGFGTSAPEILVSASSALKGVSGIALGNAYGSNITNIALILGMTALLKPIKVTPEVVKKALPFLLFVTLLSAYFLFDAHLTQREAVILLLFFTLYIGHTIRVGIQNKNKHLSENATSSSENMPMQKAILFIIGGLLLLMTSSQLLVWGAVEIARYLGVSDLVIGLTVIAIGTSLPELASSMIAARKGEADLALGNLVGSNLFNSLAVVGIAGAILPMQVEATVFSRDVFVMGSLTLLLFFFALNFPQKTRKITRLEGGMLFLCYLGYVRSLLHTSL